MTAYKNYSIKLLIHITVLVVIGLSGCFSEWRGDSAQIVISLGSADRAAYNPADKDTQQKLKHDIVLTGAAGKLEFNRSGAIFEAYVAPGKWNISVYSYLGSEIYAIGSKDVVLKAGQNNETIKMYEALFVTFDAGDGRFEGNQKVLKVPVPKHGRVKEPTIPVRQGFLFGGWYESESESDFGVPFEFDTEITYSIPLSAKWFVDDGKNTEIIIEMYGTDESVMLEKQSVYYIEAINGNVNKDFSIIEPEKYKNIQWYLNGVKQSNTSLPYKFTGGIGVYDITVVATLISTGETRSNSFTVIIR
jgi:hypothetical protein